MAASVTLKYTAFSVGTSYTGASLKTAMAAAAVTVAPTTFLSGFLGGVTVTSDVTANDVDVNSPYRTIVLNITNAKFQTRFGSNPTAPFKGFMVGIIEAAICMPVVMAAPVAA